MQRVTLQMPDTYITTTFITVQIGDLNYGNHLSNDVYFKFLHEARVQFLSHFGYTEMDIEGTSVIMGDAAIVYKSECFYGDKLSIEVSASDWSLRSFGIFYRITKNDKQITVAHARTGMIFFDYTLRKTVPVPRAFKEKYDSCAKKGA